jgi:hypothetical protein
VVNFGQIGEKAASVGGRSNEIAIPALPGMTKFFLAK